MSQAIDKKALLGELKLDRNAPSESRDRGPLKWFALLAVIAGVVFTLWAFDKPQGDEIVPIKSVLARSIVAAAQNSSVLDATGYVVARRQATVSAKTTGKVVEVLIEEGLVVSEGQLLARLDDSIPRAQFELAASQLRSAQAGLVELEIQLKKSELDLGRTQGLAERNLASQADLDRDDLNVQGLIARLARAQSDIQVAERAMAVQQQVLDDMQIRAPFAGVVVAKAAQPGEMISPISAGGGFTRTGICTIVDMESLEIEVDVNESYINRVSPGQPVSVTLNAYPDDSYAAQVIAIIPAADRNKATVRVRVGFVEKDTRVLPDMGVRVAFLTNQEPQAKLDELPQGVVIPSSAIARDDAGQFVFVVNNDVVSRRVVRTGQKSAQGTQVLTGLTQGERVVAQLSDELIGSLQDGQKVSQMN